MTAPLWLVPALPLLGFLVLGLRGRRLSRRLVAVVGTGVVTLAAVLTIVLAAGFIATPPAGDAVVQTSWTWFAAGDLRPALSFRLDALSLVFALVVTVVGSLILLYSSAFMAEDEGFSRFFAYMDLFVASMLVLVLGADLLVLYLGWEGVGLCSYLLIGFWYKDAANGRAARKAFVVTRVGDTALAVGLFLIFSRLGTLDIADAGRLAAAQWPVGSGVAVAAAALLLGGALGKSAQLPLQTWLPDAMAGPTPVSALIHASTMVTAGVYLVARMHPLFELAPPVMVATGAIGAVTLLVAGSSALVQTDIKRVLAYSTMSQIGYMFLALGAGAWTAAVFHFVTHAFFKALLFLGAGVVILGLGDEHDIFRMGGLKKRLPLVYWTFLAGAASLAALPFITAGFYSKEWILSSVWTGGGPWLWAAGLAGAFLTALYAFRLVFLVFHGPATTGLGRRPGPAMTGPLVVLAVLSLGAGFVQTPRLVGNIRIFARSLRSVLPEPGSAGAVFTTEAGLTIASSAAVLVGLLAAYAIFLKRRDRAIARAAAGAPGPFARFLRAGWGFDRLYDAVFVRPLGWLARVNRNDIIDAPYRGLGRAAEGAHALLSRTQTGRLRWYAAAVAVGAIVVIAVAVFL